MKITEYTRYLQVKENNEIKIHKRNNTGAPGKYDIQIKEEEVIESIQWIEIVGYFYNKKILRVIDWLTIYFELLLEIQYQNFN